MKKGTKIVQGQYSIQEKLGPGPFGTLYLALDRKSGADVAVLSMEGSLDDEEIAILGEFQIYFNRLAALDHPSIAKFHGFAEDGNDCFLVMEHVPHPSLGEYLASQPGKQVSLGEAVRLCGQIADALDLAHKNSLLHLQLTPDTLRVSPDGVVKITGLGLTAVGHALSNFPATDEEEDEEEKSEGGSDGTTAEGEPISPFTAPEQIEGAALTPATDQFALGALFYQMISGDAPFGQVDLEVRRRAIMEEVPPPLKSLSPLQNQALLHAIAKNKRYRFNSCGEFITVMLKSIEPKSRSPQLLVILAVIALFAGLGWQFTRDEEPAPPPTATTPPPAPEKTTPAPVAAIPAPPPVSPAPQQPMPQPQAATPRTAPGTAMLHLFTKPPGAIVHLDGQKLGVTPFAGEKLPSGPHQIRLTHRYYGSVEETLNLVDGAIVKRTYDLPPGYGSLTIDSAPSGAEVTLNGQPLGSPTPVTLGQLQAGRHEVKLKKAPCLTGAANPEVMAETMAKVEIALQGEGLVPYQGECLPPDVASRREAVRIEALKKELLALAEEDFNANRMVLPPEGNALERFRAVLEIEPENAQATKGVLRIVERYHLFAGKALDAGDLTQADRLLATVAEVKAGRAAAERQAALSGRLEQLRLIEPQINHARAALANKDWTLANDALAMAEKILPGHPEIARLRKRIAEQRVKPESNPRPGMQWRESSTGITFTWIPGGCFSMGAADDSGDDGSAATRETPVHEVCVDSFWMGVAEVTNAQYRRFQADHDSGQMSNINLNQDGLPVVNVSWSQAAAFARWLTLGDPDNAYRLPTEAEWEFAARADVAGPTYWPSERPELACQFANVLDRSAFRVFQSTPYLNCDDGHPAAARVAGRRPNPWGLYDMLGNAAEWVMDRLGPYVDDREENPLGPASGDLRVIRGGGFDTHPQDLRLTKRAGAAPGYQAPSLGFRLVKSH